MRTFNTLLLLVISATGDECGDVCQALPGVCGKNGSFCKESSGTCHDLFWTSKRVGVCNKSIQNCPSVDILYCTEARTARDVVLGRISSGVREAIETVSPSLRSGSPDIEEAIRRSLTDSTLALESTASKNPTTEEEELEEALRRSMTDTISESPVEVVDSELEATILKSLDDHGGQEYVPDARAGRRGLHNLGASCYMNAVLQVFAHSGSFTDLVLHHPPTNQANRVSVELANFIRSMWQLGGELGSEPLAPLQFLNAVREASGAPLANMEDASEFIQLVIASMDDNYQISPGLEDARKTVMDAQIVQGRRCAGCKGIRSLPEPATQVILPIAHLPTGEDSVTLADCFRALSVGNTYPLVGCPFCDGYYDAEFSSWIGDRLPQVLLISLRRFGADGENKVLTRVSVPPVLEMRDFGVQTDTSTEYALIGIVHHIGDKRTGGHYVADVLHSHGGVWLHANDRDVHEIQTYTQVSSTAYILVYERL